MSRQRIAMVEFLQDLDTKALTVITGCDRNFMVEAKESEEIQANLIAPFVDAYQTITGKKIAANPVDGSLEPSEPHAPCGRGPNDKCCVKPTGHLGNHHYE